jgi:hypothetical protein
VRPNVRVRGFLLACDFFTAVLRTIERFAAHCEQCHELRWITRVGGDVVYSGHWNNPAVSGIKLARLPL